MSAKAPRRRSFPALTARWACLLFGLYGCAPDVPGGVFPLSLRWSFVDGRSCTDAGVVSVEVDDAGTRVARAIFADCEKSRVGAPSSMPQLVGLVPPGERSYDVIGTSGGGGTLYHSILSVDAEQHPEVDVVLMFAGGN
jgi:hypothetical protein